MGGGQLSRRLVVRVSFVLAAVFGFSLFVATAPAQAQAPPPCTSVDLGITKSITPRTVEEGDVITHTLRITSRSTTMSPAVECGPVSINVTDFATPNQTFTGENGPATCSGAIGPIVCTYTLATVQTTTQTDTLHLFFDAGPGPEYCDNATVAPAPPVADSNPGNNNTGAPTCASAPEDPTPPPDGGGGDLDDGFEGGGFGGGFGGFGTGFSTASTPLGGVDTGAGGTAGSNAAVPQIALASLLTIGFLLFGLRRLRRA